MNLAIKNVSNNTNTNTSTIIWAIVASILLHVLLAVALPSFNFDSVKKIPEVLKVELLAPKVPEPAPEVIPEPAKPEPIKQVVKAEPVTKPEVKQTPKKVEAPSPIKEEYTPPPTAVIDTEPKVIAVEPKADSPTPVETTPVVAEPVIKAKPEVSQVDVDNAIGEYGSMLGRAIAKYKSYPKIAQMRGWQGECLLDIRMDGNGNVISAKVRDSTGHEALDNQALEMVRKASPLPTPPEALRSRTFNITIPVSFKLE